MKRIKYFSILLIFGIGTSILTSCNQSASNEDKAETVSSELPNKTLGSDEMPKIYFKENEYDFGKIVAGERITHAFKFTNTGGTDLIISNVTTSCGCTVSEFPTEPIKPGKSGVIKLTFDSQGRVGYQNKTATIETNAKTNKVFLRLKATVKKS